MGWFQSVYTKRAMISIDNTAGSATGDVDVTIPKDWDDFWTSIDSSGLELRAVSYDSQTVLTYAVDDGAGGAFSKTLRKGRIRIDALTLPAVANSTVGVWLYYGTSTTQGTGASAVAMAAPKNGYIEISRPGQHRFAHQAQIPGAPRPRFTLHKRVGEEVFIWVDVARSLSYAAQPSNGAQAREELYYAVPSVLDIAGADQVATMADSSRNRFVSFGKEIWYKMLVKGGTTATNYTPVATMWTILPGGTTHNQRLESAIGMHVRDTRHSS